MKTEFLKDLGLEQDAIDKIMAENGKDVDKAKKPGETASERVAELEGQLADVGEKLKAFDGVDVEGLKGQVAALQADIATKDTEYQQKISDRDFSDLLSAEILAASGKNPKAIKALLDVDTLKSSKNQKEDAAAALKKLAESDAYLFGTESTPPITVSTGGKHSENSSTDDPFVAAAMRGAGLGNDKGE